MKTLFKIFLFSVLLGWTGALCAQTYNNEWIDYSKTYYKFKLATTGLYRISASTLQTLGLGNTPGAQFQLWRNGKVVPIYISSSDETQALGTSDYIEFWGVRNDGVPDAALYKLSSSQLDQYSSLETDSASFFLTVNTTTPANAHYSKSTNTIPSGATAESYCWATWEYHGHDQVNKGRAQAAYGDYIYSSTYDIGEGWTSSNINSGNTFSPSQITGLSVNTSGPSATLSVGVVGTSTLGTARTVDVLWNSTKLASARVDSFASYNFSIAISDLNPLLSNSYVNVTHNTVPVNSNDRLAVSYMKLNYPRNMDFGGSAVYGFQMKASSVSSYLAITGYTENGFTPVLYDVTNGIRYTATKTNGQLQYYINASATDRQLVFIGQNNQNTSITTFTTKTYTDYKSTAGNYLIISGSILRSGDDPVEKYRAYRASTQGGSYNAVIYDIDQLTDQFAFGIPMHPSAVKNFLKYARTNFSVAPKYVLLIGHGLSYDQYYSNQSQSTIPNLAIIPTFGWPASDVLLASDDYSPIASIPIGRITATSTTEVQTYLDKIKEYESYQQSTVQTIDAKGWQKNFVHIAGGSDASESNSFINYLMAVENVVKDTLIGANVYNFNKNTNGESAVINSQLLNTLFKSGIGMINYWGHASSTKLDYNLDDPSNYSNSGKYPLFYVSGCDVAGYFDYSGSRISSLTTIPENYVFESNAGAIGFIAQSYLGVTSFMYNFNNPVFRSLSNTNYGNPVSESLIVGEKAIIGAGSYLFNDTLSTNAQLEQNLLLGDPVIRISPFAKPDFAIEDASVTVSPSYIDISKSSFHVKAYINNLGKATGDSLLIQVKHQHTDGSSEFVYNKRIKSVRYKDSIEFDVPIISAKDKGQNIVSFSLDPLNQYDELSESNNVLNKTVNIYAVGLTPVYPYEYAIVNKQNIKLIASTANPIAATTQYAMEIDTTALFNSNLKARKTLSSFGGVLEFDPGISFMDSTVYYWRVAAIPTDGDDYHWNVSSFEYISKASVVGFNQSHVYQQFNLEGDRISLDSSSRNWNFDQIPTLFELRNGVFGVSSSQASDFSIAINTTETTRFHCNWDDGIVVNVFDGRTFEPYYNQSVPSTFDNGGEGGYMGSYGSSGCSTGMTIDNVKTNFEFLNSTTGRQQASKLLDWIPDGSYVVVRMFPNYYNGSQRIPAWKTDPTENNLYNHLIGAGFTNIDSSDFPKNWAFVYRKNTASFTPIAIVTASETDQVNYTTTFSTPDSLGYITSPTFGPSKAWHDFKWKGYSLDKTAGDKASVDIYGVNYSNQSTYIQTVPMGQESVDISGIDAATYPYIKLIMRNADSLHNTPYQLKYWQLTYDPIPEGALAANVYYNSGADSLNKGTDYNMSIAFKNISDTKFSDSIKVNYTLTDKNNVAHTISLPKLKALEPGDTALIKLTIPGTSSTTNSLNTTTYTGNNTQYLDVNPSNDQVEYTHVNNFLSKALYVNGDDGNASLDVTFDGLHILNNDIISSKPQIIAKLASDSKAQLLSDTSLLSVYLKYPDGAYKRFRYGTDTLLFTQAKDTANNYALANFAPYLTQDGTYQLIIQGKASTEATSSSQYAVSFQVYNKPMISDMFNYPNPFTTSTAFVFTLTGSQIPQNLRIQVLTITGKIVKEITKDELGPLHIGRNITDYKWDGTDMYGQKLANGVYIYRVITNLEGKKLDHFNITDATGNGGSTSQYFNKGYGKMYLMR